MWTHSAHAAVLAPRRDRVVEVPGVVGVDREGGQLAQVHARVGRVGLVHGCASRLGGRGARVAAVQAAVEHQALDHVARHGRGGRAGAPRARRACPSRPAPGRPRPRRRARPRVRGPGPNSGSATRKRPRFSSTATIGSSSRPATAAPHGGAHRSLRAACRARPGSASSRVRVRVVLRLHLRLDALAGDDRLAVRAGSSAPTVSVELAAVREGSTSCTRPLPNVFVPTTVARWRSRSAPVTISDALALPPSTSTTTGTSCGSIASPIASWVRSARWRPAHGDDLAVLDEDARHEPRPRAAGRRRCRAGRARSPRRPRSQQLVDLG